MYNLTQKRLFRVEPINSILPQIGEVFDTNETFDKKRIQRYSDLRILFEKINNCSTTYHLQVGIILELITTTDTLRFDFIISQILVGRDEIIDIKNLYEETKFNIYLKEGSYLFDFYLELARKKIFDEYGLDLPDRFKSKFFFESIKDCLKYMKVHGIGKIIEIEPIEIKKYLRADNNFLSSFDNDSDSFDLIKQAEDYLLKKETINPLFEIVICGRYRVVSYVGWFRLLKYNFSKK